MEALLAIMIGALTAGGIYLTLRGRTFPVILGIAMLSHAVNLFLVSMGRVTLDAPPVIRDGVETYADPLPQALVLTAIVIGFAMIAYVLVLALRGRRDLGNDHVDGNP